MQLEIHRREGHRRFLRERAECRAGAIKQRQHRRLPDLLRPGGELRVGLSGPHYPGRFPSDLQEHYAIRPQHFLMGVYRAIPSGELQQQADDERHAEERTRPEEAVPGENAAAASPPKGAGAVC